VDQAASDAVPQNVPSQNAAAEGGNAAQDGQDGGSNANANQDQDAQIQNEAAAEQRDAQPGSQSSN